MQDKTIEMKLTSVIKKLREAALKKVEEIKFLEDKITKLNIENAKLHNTISNIEKKSEKTPPTTEQEASILDKPETQNIGSKQLVSEETDDNIDISINQLKGILDKNWK